MYTIGELQRDFPPTWCYSKDDMKNALVLSEYNIFPVRKSIVDGVDGNLARLKGMTSTFGGFLDSVLDRYADILIVLGLTFWSFRNEVYPGIWLVGFLAIAGTICISYSRSRIDAEHRHLFKNKNQGS